MLNNLTERFEEKFKHTLSCEALMAKGYLVCTCDYEAFLSFFLQEIQSERERLALGIEGMNRPTSRLFKKNHPNFLYNMALQSAADFVRKGE